MPTSDLQYAHLRELLRKRVADYGEHAAYVFLGHGLETSHSLSYAALGQSAEAIAKRLRARIGSGDRVLLAFDNNLDAVQLFWGCILAGAIPVPAPAPDNRNAQNSESRSLGIANNADVALAMTDEGHSEAGRTQIPERTWCTLDTLLNEPLHAFG